jgi:uncharacterized protein
VHDRSRWRRRVIGVLAGVAALYAGAIGAARLASRALMFQPPPGRVDVEGASLIETTAPGGRAVRAFAVGLDRVGDGPVLLHFHGNASRADHVLPLAREVAGFGVAVVLAEYRGYGVSSAEGPSTESGLYEDAEALVAELDKRGVQSSRLVLWGTSLGSGVACELASRGRGAGLVLETPYTSMADMATRVLPIAPGRWLVRDVFDNAAKAPSIRVPSLVVHGDADEIVPFAMGEALARAIPGATWRVVPGGHHNDLHERDAALAHEIAAHARRSARRISNPRE